jgi:hypothetical protein
MRFLILILIFLSWNFISSPEQLQIQVFTEFNGEPIQLYVKKYVNANGDSLSIESFRFYLGNFVLYSQGKKYPIKNSYFLVDASSEASKKINLQKSFSGKVDSISFCIGVDSAMSVAGALDGALDPTLGMYWAWNTGYINAKLEGKSPSCKTLHQAYEFHIGGYLRPYNALRKVTLICGEENIVKLRADASKWMNGREKISLSKLNSVVMPCKEAMLVADDYQQMFSVIK